MAQVGDTLICSQGLWDDVVDTYTYRPHRDGVPIQAASASNEYALSAADEGHMISFEVIATNDAGSESSFTAAIGPIEAAPGGAVTPPVNTVAPAITGTIGIGRELVLDPGTWTGDPDALQSQLLRDGVVIPGATSGLYTCVAADCGPELTLRVTAVKAGTDNVIATSAARTFSLADLGTLLHAGNLRGSPLANAAPVVTWPDTSGAGRDATQVVTSKQGIFSAADESIDIDGTTDTYPLDDPADFYAVHEGAAAMIFRVNLDADSGKLQTLFSSNGGTTAHRGIFFTLDDRGSKNKQLLFILGRAVASNPVYSLSTVHPDPTQITGNWGTVAVTWDTTNCRVAYNGVVADTATYDPAKPFSSGASSVPPNLFNTNAKTWALDGKCQDAVIYSSSLTDNDLASVHSYLEYVNA